MPFLLKDFRRRWGAGDFGAKQIGLMRYPSHSSFYKFQNIPLGLAYFTNQKPERPKRSGGDICDQQYIAHDLGTRCVNMLALY